MNKRRGLTKGFLLMGSAVLIFSILLAGCATTPPVVVMVSKDYPNAEPQRVALIGFRDYPGVTGSGEITAGIFEKYLLLADYRLVERRQVAEIMQEQALESTGAIDPETLRKIGRLLGVTALVFGNVDDCTSPRDRTVMVDMPQEQTVPIYSQQETIQKVGETVLKTTQPYVSGYSTSISSRLVAQEETLPAHIGISVRLVDVETGEVLWTASASGEGPFLNDAIEKVSLKIIKAVNRIVKRREARS